MPDDSLLETMTHAADALLCRAAAGRSQLSSAMLLSDIKQSVIDDAVARMTGVCIAAEFTVLLSDRIVQNCANYEGNR